MIGSVLTFNKQTATRVPMRRGSLDAFIQKNEKTIPPLFMMVALVCNNIYHAKNNAHII
jgi:hypothetical protein